MKKNEMYVAPELEILNVMVECGFAGSSESGIEDMEDGGDA